MSEDFLADLLTQQPYRPQPLLVVLSGPSGAGKDTILARMRQLGRPYHIAVTATTRPQRPTERDGVDYIFLSVEEFLRLRDRGELLEWAQVYGHYYGVPKEQVRQALARGQDVLLRVDVQGAATLRRLVPQGVFIFITPPSFRELERRLRLRGTDPPEALAERLRIARSEMACLPSFTHLVVNEDGQVDRAVATIDAIITAEKHRIPPRKVVI